MSPKNNMSKNNKPPKLPFSTESWQTRGLDCSRLSPQQESTPTAPKVNSNSNPNYLQFLRETLPPHWTADAPHIRLIADHLDAVERGDIDRLAIHMPPRHGKSETVTYRYPVHCLERDPASNVLVTGYNERFARKFGRRNRNLAQIRGLVGSDKTAADEWETTAGGLLMTRGVGSPPTGTGFKRIVMDDPIRRRQDAESETVRAAMEDWYTDDLYTRLEPGGASVLIMTPWHEADIGVFAVASEPGRWTVLKLTAIAEENDLLNRPVGTALWDERFPLSALLRIKEVMSRSDGERSWEALYQQNPTPKEGAFFKVGKLGYVDALPAGLRACRKWDIAATAGDGDYSAGVKVAGPDAEGFWYVAHSHRGQWASDERNQQMRETAAADGTGVKILVPQDPGAAGVDMARALVRLFSGYNVSKERESGSKEARADAFSAQVNAGNVRLVRGDWNKAFVEELRTFPGGKHDDQVDAASGAFNDLAVVRPKVKVGIW